MNFSSKNLIKIVGEDFEEEWTADRKSLLKVASEMLEELKNPGENDIPSDLIPDMLLLAEYDEDLGKTPFQIA